LGGVRHFCDGFQSIFILEQRPGTRDLTR
jgi:hypothetical protein